MVLAGEHFFSYQFHCHRSKHWNSDLTKQNESVNFVLRLPTRPRVEISPCNCPVGKLYDLCAKLPSFAAPLGVLSTLRPRSTIEVVIMQ